jgi:hypothetical protein
LAYNPGVGGSILPRQSGAAEKRPFFLALEQQAACTVLISEPLTEITATNHRKQVVDPFLRTRTRVDRPKKTGCYLVGRLFREASWLFVRLNEGFKEQLPRLQHKRFEERLTSEIRLALGRRVEQLFNRLPVSCLHDAF